MMSTYLPPIVCDLQNNFLTHSYFNVLEKYLAYDKSSSSKESRSALLKAIQSFLFIYESTPSPNLLLDQCIFTHYIAYTTLSTHHALSLVKFNRFKRAYTKAMATSLNDSKKTQLNKGYVQGFYHMAYSSWSSIEQLPQLFNVSTAQDFMNEIKILRDFLLQS